MGSRVGEGVGVERARNAVAAVGVTVRAHTSNCVSVSMSAVGHCGPIGRYTSVARRRGRAPDLSTARGLRRRGTRCRRPNKAHSHATERTRTLPSRTRI